MSTSDHITQQVIAAFQGCFPNDAITHESDFFDLGGDSLALVELCTALEASTGLEVETSAVLYNPMVEELAGALQAISEKR